MMKEFFWQYFSRCGNVDAYLLYKESEETSSEPAEQMDMSVLEPPVDMSETVH